MTIQLKFTAEQIAELRYQRYNHPVPLVQRRMEMLLLKAYGLAHEQIIENLKEINYRRPDSELVKHTVMLESYFRENPPASIKEAQEEIENITGVKRSESQEREFLKNLICVVEK